MDATNVDEPSAHSNTASNSFWVASSGLLILPSLFWLWKRPDGAFPRWAGLFPLSLAVACFSWLYVVSAVVPEPYLDEIFHIPQAQKYCEGRFQDWDDKITTPPGLYLLSLLIPGVVKPSTSAGAYVCDAQSLRASSAIALIVLAYLALRCRHEIEARLWEAHSATKLRLYSQYSLHTAFNIALFPLLFFFSGLYYTDVASTTVVLLAYLNHLQRLAKDQSSFVSDLVTIVLGIMTLFMRQTNVFWVVVYMGGVEVVHAIKTLRPERVDQPRMFTLSEQLKYYLWRYSVGDIHDPPLHDLFPEDMLYCIVSLGVAAICNPIQVARQIWPYVAILASFGSFVFWNGGVVLGDKSNHVATIHLPQMLYIWPFFGFFSLPLLIPYALPIANISLRVCRMLTFQKPPVPSHSSPSPGSSRSSLKPKIISKRRAEVPLPDPNTPASTDPSPKLSAPLQFIASIFSQTVLWPFYLLGTIVLSYLIVGYNTIIHPFTLADNRHYMFYIFRYTIRRSLLIRYLLIVPYTFARWMTWGTMAGCSQWFFMIREDACSSYYKPRQAPFLSNPSFIRHRRSVSRQTDTPFPVEVPVVSQEVEATQLQDLRNSFREDPMLVSVEPASSSTGLIFLLATTLSLITAPLVEPRYFIIPWVMWRLLVPAWRLHDHEAAPFTVFGRAAETSWGKGVVRVFERYDLRLILETGWFVAIHVVTGYIFLCKPYLWKAEDGTVLDDGRLQRFMW